MYDPPEITQDELKITSLGARSYSSPLGLSTIPGDGRGDYVPDDARLLYEARVIGDAQPCALSFELAGPREHIYFSPAEARPAIVTCGGLCPGLNNIIRSLTYELSYNYGVTEVLGIRDGYRGLSPELARKPLLLNPAVVEGIHHHGGTILGTSRGPIDPAAAVDSLVRLSVNILYCIGGDGTQRGAHAIAGEIQRRELPISVVGIPKTIDNDVKFCFSTFGFYSAVAEAELAIDRAHIEAKSVLNGVGLVKLMGRDAGFIAAAATVASGEANFCLIPEQLFELDGPTGFLSKLRRRLEAREHAVVVIAEGAGQQLMSRQSTGSDASGNERLGDVGLFLKDRIQQQFAEDGFPVSVKYFDPSYQIRSVSATAFDSLLCERFARAAAHAGMAGKTNMLVGLWHNRVVHVPLATSTGRKKQVDVEGELWNSVLALTGQDKW